MKRTRLSEVVHIISGGTPQTKEPEYWKGEIKWLSIGDFRYVNKYVETSEKTISEEALKNSSTKLLKINDIIISARGTVGAMAMLKEEMAFNQSCFGLRSKDVYLNQDYLYYYLKYYIKSIKSKTQGSVFETINLSTFDMLDIDIIDMRYQDKIAHILSAVDNKIELNIKQNKEIDTLTRTIYDYWFTQFEFPDKTNQPYMSSGGRMFWNEKLKRDIPVGWKDGRIENLGEVILGGTPKTSVKKNYSDHGIAWITPNDLSNKSDMYISHGERDISEIGLESSSAKLMPSGSVLLTTRAPIGYLAIAINEVCTNQGFKSIVPNEGLSSEYVFYTIKRNMPKIISLGSGTTFKEVSKDSLSNLEVILPDENVIDRFNKVIFPFAETRKKCELENKYLGNLREFLLPLLMNGQVGFKEDKN